MKPSDKAEMGIASTTGMVMMMISLPFVPDELWDAILSHPILRGLDELRSMANTCQEWRRLLRPKWHILLFPKIFPYLLKYLEERDVLNLRLVSMAICQGVDEVMVAGSHLAPYRNQGKQGDVHSNDFIPRSSVWKRIARSSSFPYRMVWGRRVLERPSGEVLVSMLAHPRNPFIGRELRIETARSRGLLPLIRCIGSIMPQLGSHLWYLHLELLTTDMKMSELGNLLQAVFRNTPNLRQLQICARHISGYLPNKYKTLLEATHLRFLQTLQLDNWEEPSIGKNDFRLDDFLIQKYSAQLGRLQVRRWNPYLWHKFHFPQLTELAVSATYLVNPLPIVDTSIPFPVHVLESISKLAAPNLQLVHFPFVYVAFGGFGKQRVNSKMLSNFPKLRSIEIVYSNCWRHDAFRLSKYYADADITSPRDSATYPLVTRVEFQDWDYNLKIGTIVDKVLAHFPNVRKMNVYSCCNQELLLDITDPKFWRRFPKLNVADVIAANKGNDD